MHIVKRLMLVGGLAIIFLLVMGLALVSLRAQKTTLEVATEAKVGNAAISAAQKARQEINVFNKELRAMTFAFADRSWSTLLEEIGNLSPAGMSIKDVKRETANDKETLVISGHASKREDLVSFEEGLKKSPSFTSVTSPLANFRKPEDIDFTINAELAAPK